MEQQNSMTNNMNFSHMTEELINIEQNKQTCSIIHACANGLRGSIRFEQKPSYTIDELLIIINALDDAWKAISKNKSDNFTYIQ